MRLNLTICKNSTLSLSVPVEINEDIDKLNSSSAYFNDICYSSTSDSGTDIILKDRKTEFIEGNKTVCQDDCEFYEYNHYTKVANCSCQIRESSASFSNMTINKTKLYENFGQKNKKDNSNIKVTSCNILSSTKNIKSNAGFYSLLFILAAFVVIFIIFCSKGYSQLEGKINDVIYNQFIKEKEKIKVKKKVKKYVIRRIPKIINKNNNSTLYQLNKRNLGAKNKNKNSNNMTTVLDNIINTSEAQKIKPDTDYEYNWLSYDNALRCDKRSYCEYYCSLIRSKQLFIFTFCSFNDYNSNVIKKFLFFLSFAFHYTSNALFFTDSNLHKIYEDKGKFDFEYQMPYIIYSAIIATGTLRLMLQFLVLTDKDILEVKQQQNQDLAINMKIKKLKCVKIKLGIFFSLNLILLGLFWYYLTCFNAIYKNTQIYLIENTFISFGISLFYPFIVNIIPMMLRMCSIHSVNKDKECLYKMSQIAQLI